MEQPDPVSQKARELVQVQLGSQILALCEVTARLELAEAQLKAAHEMIDALKKAGTSEA